MFSFKLSFHVKWPAIPFRTLWDLAIWNEMKLSQVIAKFPFVFLEQGRAKEWDDNIPEAVLEACVSHPVQSTRDSCVIWRKVSPEWWCSLKSSCKVKPRFGYNFKSDMFVSWQLSWPELHLTVFLHPLVDSEQIEMSPNTGSRVEAYLQLDNQQQVWFLWLLVHLTLRRQEDISNVLNMNQPAGKVLWNRSIVTQNLLWVRSLLDVETDKISHSYSGRIPTLGNTCRL